MARRKLQALERPPGYHFRHAQALGMAHLESTITALANPPGINDFNDRRTHGP